VAEGFYTRQDVLDAMEELTASGFGELTVKVSEHKIAQIEVLIRKRKAPRAAQTQSAAV
jgi:hypothetical protein